MFKTYLSLKNTSELHFNNKNNDSKSDLIDETLPSFEFLKNTTDQSLPPIDLVSPQRPPSTMTDSVIIIGLTCFYTCLTLILITLVYFRHR